MKHLMVRLHWENGNVVTELKRRGINRKTWFDSKWRYRGVWTTTWTGDRDYIVELVRKLIDDAREVERLVSHVRPAASRSPASQPIHSSAAAVIKRVNDSHAASMEDARMLREIANRSSVTKALPASDVLAARHSPVIVDPSEVAGQTARRTITSRRWGQPEPWGESNKKSIRDANRELQQISASKEPAVCVCGCDRLRVRSRGKVRWWSCESCGSNVGHSWVDRRHPVRR